MDTQVPTGLAGICLSKSLDKSMYKYYNENYYDEGGVIMPADEQKLWGVWGQANGIYSSWAASKGVNYYLMLVLYALEGQTAMTQKKICICTGLTKQTVNSVIRTLKEDGSIELAPGCEDRREKQIVLTEKGIAYSGELLASLREMERRVLRIMGNDRAQQMVDSITLYNTLLEKEMEKEV